MSIPRRIKRPVACPSILVRFMRTSSDSIGAVRAAARAFLPALLLLAGIRVLALEAYSIPTSSMEPTLLVGDFLLVDKLTFGARIPGTGWTLPPLRDPQRGEVVIFRPPHQEDRHYVKRVVGLPGDTLEMKGKTLYFNGAEVLEGYVQHLDARGDAVHPGMRWQRSHLAAARPRGRYVPSRDTWGPLVVPPGAYFVLGDSRDNSEDSRYWGFVDRSRIHGRPWRIYFSLAEATEGKTGGLGRIRWGRISRGVR